VQIEVRPGQLSDLDRASAVLGEAFAAYAWTRWTVDPNDHQQRITQLQRIAMRSYGLPFGKVWVGVVDDTVQSAAVWMDSAIAVPSGVREEERSITAELEGVRHEASVAAERQISGWRPGERHFYLATVGTAPAMQRRGLAAAVLQAGLRVADDERSSSFLETSSQSNVAFYSKLGFNVVGHQRISGGGPDVWAMLRQPGVA
jgi:ribosomal protein S18 acetylase RimI-like enzyme